MKKIDSELLRSMALFSQLGFTIATPIILCVILGNYLVNKFGLNSLFFIIFILIGVYIGFYNAYKLIAGTMNKK